MCPSRVFFGLETRFVGVSTSRTVFVTGLSTPLIYENVPVMCFPGLIMGMFTRVACAGSMGIFSSTVYPVIVFARIEMDIWLLTLLSGYCFRRVIEMT